MKVLLFLFIPFIIVNNLSEYSINPFINYLKEKGFYEMIENVKIIYGSDCAIDVCKYFTNNTIKDCEDAVTIYMEATSYTRKEKYFFDSEEETEKETKTERETKTESETETEIEKEAEEEAEMKKKIETEIKFEYNELLNFLLQDENLKVLSKYYTEKEIKNKVIAILKSKILLGSDANIIKQLKDIINK